MTNSCHKAWHESGVSQIYKGLPKVTIDATQCRGARAMVGWTQTELAAAAGVSRPTIVDFERGVRTPHPNNLTAIRAALERAGVQFIAQNGGGAGVRM
jgi:DNA-binding XRE family transcriptional regulator